MTETPKITFGVIASEPEPIAELVQVDCRAEHPADRQGRARHCVRKSAGHTQHIDALGRRWTNTTDIVLRPGEEGRIPEIAIAWLQAHRERDHLAELEAAVTVISSAVETAFSPTPAEWLDGQGDTWREDPENPDRLRVVREANGVTVPRSDYHDRAFIQRVWGGLRRLSTTVPAVPTAPVTSAKLGTSVGADADRIKIANAAAALEDLLVMTTQAVQDLRDVDANVAAPVPYGATSRRGVAYARLYFLRRELGRVVATLGAEAPPTKLLKDIERDYRGQLQEITEFEEEINSFGL